MQFDIPMSKGIRNHSLGIISDLYTLKQQFETVFSQLAYAMFYYAVRLIPFFSAML